MSGPPPWIYPIVVAAIVAPITAGFLIAGPSLGLAVGFVTAAVLVWIVVTRRLDTPIEPRAPRDRRDHLLIALTRELDDPRLVRRIVSPRNLDREPDAADVLVLAPATARAIDRWAGDYESARTEAQRKLVVSVASLAAAHVEASAAVGDDDPIQAIEDRLRTFPATEVILVTGNPADDPAGERAAAELEHRLSVPFTHVVEP